MTGAVHLVVWGLDEFGGMEHHVAALAFALAEAKRPVTLFCEMPVPAFNRYARDLRAAGIEVVAPSRIRHTVAAWLEQRRLYRLVAGLNAPPSNGWPGIEEEYRRYQYAPASTFGLLRALARRPAPSVVHVHGCRLAPHRVLQWAAGRAIPTVYTEHLTIADWAEPWDPAAPMVVAATADIIACVSEHSRDSLAERLPLPRAIHLARHLIGDPGPPSARRPVPRTILAVGRLAPYKGHDVLLQAAALLRDEGVAFRLAIAGGGDRTGLEALRSSLGLENHVDLLGPIDPPGVAGLWRKADVAVSASLTEGLPVTMVEAMAHGCAIVATRVGGIPELIHDNANGLLVPPGDPVALAAALARVMREPGLASRLGAAARQNFERDWSGAAVTAQALALYVDAARSFAVRRKVMAADAQS